MSGPPTLGIKGHLRAPDGDPQLQARLDGYRPIDYILDWFRERMSRTGIENRVLILKAETASGKSTMFPPELYRAFVKGAGPGIICTQPRVLTAIANVMDMLKHYSRDLRLGDTVGWSTRFNKLRPQKASLLSATIGTLAQQLKVMKDADLVGRYRFILIDETHERNLETDMTIYMLKNFLLRNQHNTACPFVVLMSATFEPQSFLNYFGLSLRDNFIWCQGASKHIEEMWDWNHHRTISDYPRTAADIVEKIVTENPKDPIEQADILIFMPGTAEILDTAQWLERLNKKLAAAGKPVFSIQRVTAEAVQTRNRDYREVLEIPTQEHIVTINGRKYKPGRRVIITTNVAETGLTLDNLKYVIDSGFNRGVEYNPVYNVRGLITKPAPQSRIRQRRGRVGRKFDGVFYPLYPRHIYDRLPALQLPEILIEDITPIMLDIINEQLRFKQLAGENAPEFLISDIDMIDLPSPDSLAAALEKLYTLGFISPSAGPGAATAEPGRTTLHYGLTPLGKIASDCFSMLPPESVRMILAGYYWGCSIVDLVTIAAYLTMSPKDFVGANSAANVTATTSAPRRPHINWTSVYSIGLPGYFSSTGLIYKTRLLIADEFIDGLILYNAAKYIVAQIEISKSIAELRNWCANNCISYAGILNFIRARDDLIEQMLTAGLDVFKNEDRALIHTPADSLMDTITRIKHCIYDGYRNNLLIEHTSTGTYHTTMGLEVMKPRLFSETEATIAEKNEYGFAVEILPRVLVYSTLSLKFNRKNSMYSVLAERISTLDGFVSVDLDFANGS